jgi:hypothetical protein
MSLVIEAIFVQKYEKKRINRGLIRKFADSSNKKCPKDRSRGNTVAQFPLIRIDKTEC